jgi:hypothetical protein
MKYYVHRGCMFMCDASSLTLFVAVNNPKSAAAIENLYNL